MFPRDFCSALERLQANAPSHSPQQSRSAVEAAFGMPLSDIFVSFDDKPVASGSIAQIHRARLNPEFAKRANMKPNSYVAVKVRPRLPVCAVASLTVLRMERAAAHAIMLPANTAHFPLPCRCCEMPIGTVVRLQVRHPGVTTLMHRDFILMMRAARLSKRVPALRQLRLDESVRQFGGPLKEQLDLACEARHLSRFAHNFRLWRHVSFPAPIYPFVSSDVLVETFEEGDLISGCAILSAVGAVLRLTAPTQ